MVAEASATNDFHPEDFRHGIAGRYLYGLAVFTR